MSAGAWRFFAMDTAFFHATGAYPLRSRFEILADLGYDGLYLTMWTRRAWAELPQLAQLSQATGVDVAGVYTIAEVDRHGLVGNGRHVIELIDALDAGGHVDLALRVRPEEDHSELVERDEVVEFLRYAGACASARGVRLSLYPHVNFWLARLNDAVELAVDVGSQLVKVTMSAYHWFVTDGAELASAVRHAAPHLGGVNICGVFGAPGQGSGQIVPLDQGQLDCFQLLGAVAETGFEGWIGLQGFSVGGDVYERLAASLGAYRSIVDRLGRRPEWALLDPPGYDIRVTSAADPA